MVGRFAGWLTNFPALPNWVSIFQNSTGGSRTTSFMLQDHIFPVAWFSICRKCPLSIQTILYPGFHFRSHLMDCLFLKYTHFKGGKTIKNLLVSPKDKDPMLNQSGAIYRYQCNNLGCDDEYIGETSRTFGERYKEHLKAPSAIHHHSTITGHTTNHNNFQIIGREGHNLARNIKESIYIRVNNPSLNNNIGKFNLSHIWDRVLLNTKGLTLK